MQAVTAVYAGTISARKAAKTYRVPRTTLQSRVSGKYDADVRAGRKSILLKVEQKLCDFAANHAAMGFGFGKNKFLKYASDHEKKQGKLFKKGILSQKWWRLFRKRNTKIVLRQPEGTSTVRHKCLDPLKVAKFFVALEEELTSKNIISSLSRIWNMDETGMSLKHKLQKVVAGKGSEHLQSVTSGNKEQVMLKSVL